MKVNARQIKGCGVWARGEKAGKVDDIFFDVRTGDVTHLSVSLSGWYRGNVVLLQIDSCCVKYENGVVVCPQMSVDAIRQAPLLDEESARYAEITDTLIRYEDNAPCWSLSGRCCVTHTRSESLEATTGQAALWGTRDLMRAPVIMANGKTLGHVADVVLNAQSWQVTHLVIEQGHWYWPKKAEVPVNFLSEVDKDGEVTKVVLSTSQS